MSGPVKRLRKPHRRTLYLMYFMALSGLLAAGISVLFLPAVAAYIVIGVGGSLGAIFLLSGGLMHLYVNGFQLGLVAPA